MVTREVWRWNRVCHGTLLSQKLIRPVTEQTWQNFHRMKPTKLHHFSDSYSAYAKLSCFLGLGEQRLPWFRRVCVVRRCHVVDHARYVLWHNSNEAESHRS